MLKRPIKRHIIINLSAAAIVAAIAATTILFG